MVAKTSVPLCLGVSQYFVAFPKGKFTMNDEKQVPLIGDFFKLFVAVLIIVAIASVVVWRFQFLEYFNCRGTTLVNVCVWLLLLPAFLAGLWGYQAIRNFHKATNTSSYIQACMFMNKTVGIVCFISILPQPWVQLEAKAIPPVPLLSLSLALPGSLLFYILILLTTITAFIIRGRFFLHLLTVYCLFMAHILFWHEAAALIFFPT